MLNNGLPTFLSLHMRGIPTESMCPMCNEEDESHTHLFLLCPFTRAVWHGSTLAIHSFDFTNCSVQLWLKQLISRHDCKDPVAMCYLQDVFITLWTIWTYRNKVVHQGISPNPMEVILTAHTFSCRYRDILSNSINPRSSPARNLSTSNPIAAENWHLIIKIAGARSRGQCRYGIAYEALTLQGDKVLFGVASSNARSFTGALLEAVVKAGLAAKNQGFQRVLFLTDSKGLTQIIRKEWATNWLDGVRLADFCFLKQNGLFCDVFWIPHITVKDLSSVAKMATLVPLNYCCRFPIGSRLCNAPL